MKQTFKILLLISLFASIVTQCRKEKFEKPEQPEQPQKTFKKVDSEKNIPKFKAGELLVKFKNGYNSAAINAIRGKQNRHTRTKAMERVGDPGYYVIDVADVEAAVATLKKNENVKW